MRRPLVLSLLLAAALPAQAPRPLPPLAEATRIHDTRTGAVRSWPELIDALAAFDAVFLGETHVDDTTHQVELHVLEQLIAKKQGKVVLTLEMFERDVQGVLDDYLAGRCDEATFLQKARPWGNYATAYRPLVEAAKAAQVQVVAANFPASLRRALGGPDPKAAMAKLSDAQRALMPAEIFPGSAAYWERVDRAVRGHMGGGGGGTPEERLYDTQNLWDNAMGDAVAKAKAAHPDHLVLHVAGGFHVAYRDGTAAQFARRSPASTFAVVSIAPTGELHVARPDRDAAMADFMVYARTLSREENDGTWAVEVPAELRYQLEVPPHGRNLPLLVWLPDRGSRPDDALAFWRAALGDAAAIAVVHQPFPELQDDLAPGGRYAFGDGFRADYSRTSHGLARIVEYVTRKFPVDGNKVVVAGAGDGGAAVAWTALYGEWLGVDFVASEPNDLGRLGMEALPDQRPVARALHVLSSDPERPAIQKLAADYQKVGLPTTTAQATAPGVLAGAVRTRLGLPAAPAAAGATGELRVDTPRAREWRDLLALAGSGTTGGKSVLEVGGDGAFAVASFADGSGIPLAGGPFGGTTVVVLPKGVSEADRAAWFEHEKNRVLKRRNMFANIAVACTDGAPSLPEVIAALRQKGRSRFLVVPAMFCADAATMQALKASLGQGAAGLDLHWLPGLGGELAQRQR